MLATRARKWDQAIKRGTGNEPSTYAQWSLFNCKEKQNYDACKKCMNLDSIGIILSEVCILSYM